MQRTYFKEQQYFSNPGLWIFIAIVFTIAIAPTAIALYNGLVLQNPVSEKPGNSTSLVLLLVILVIMLLITLWIFKKMKLVTEIQKDGIHYMYPPFITKMRFFAKEEIEDYKIRKYKPVREYNGWGIRHSWSGYGRAFNVRGNIGLQLYLKNGKKVLFGTQRAEAMLRSMHKMMRED